MLLHHYLTSFFVRADDLPATKHVKVNILSKLATSGNVDMIISEFKVTFDKTLMHLDISLSVVSLPY